MEERGHLQLSGALVTAIELKSVENYLDYIVIALESIEFVELLGSNRIRLIFSGCMRSGFDLRRWSGLDTLHSFYVKTDELPLEGYTKYCVEMSDSGSTLEITAKGVQVEIDRTTHQHH